MSDLSDFEFKQKVYKSEQVADMHTFFKVIAKLGNTDAETYAYLEYMKAMFGLKKDTFIDGLQELVNYVGMAHFLQHTKELTRLGLITGTGFKSKKYGT